MNYNTLDIWLLFLILGIVTVALRLSFVLLVGQREMPPLLQRSLRFVPASVITALVVPEIVYQGQTFNLWVNNPRLLPGLAAALAAWYSRSIILTLVMGMGCYWLGQYFIY